MKVVVNRCFGGFGLSDAGIRRYLEIKGIPCFEKREGSLSFVEFYTDEKMEDDSYFFYGMIERTDPALIKTVEELGAVANGRSAKLEVVEIPDDVKWDIVEYDGSEHVAERHRIW